MMKNKKPGTKQVFHSQFSEMVNKDEVIEYVMMMLKERNKDFVVCRKLCSKRFDGDSINAIKTVGSFNDPIFQDHPKSKRRNDDLRRQEVNPQLDTVKNINQFLVEILSEATGDSFIGYSSVLKSFAGCREQRYHLDYDDKLEISRFCYFGLCAIEDRTTFTILDPENKNIFNVVLNMGDVLFVNGLVLHNGNSYTYDNTRLHFYFDVVGRGKVNRKLGKSYFTSDIYGIKTFGVHNVDSVKKETLGVTIAKNRLIERKEKKLRKAILLKAREIS